MALDRINDAYCLQLLHKLGNVFQVVELETQARGYRIHILGLVKVLMARQHGERRTWRRHE